MSRTIDERVVSMQFDNRHFENNVRTSLSTIEKLKQSLNFKSASKGLDGIATAARGCNLSPLSSAVDSVKVKFSALEVMAVTALSNITNSAVNTGKRMVSALTIDPVKTGLQEYETQINAIQTILANTESKGENIETVNAALDDLNTYADKTIYNFTEMTRNIGTFTAAGVGLKESTAAIKGIANLAAVSGSSSQQASTAMYQLSQALAAGRVSLMDWNSVVNAGMGGELFQNALKRTARHLGTGVDEAIKKYGTFRESLTQGQWLTTQVLTETLAQLSGAYSEAELISQGYTKEQAAEIAKLADTAVNAATKVKTFTQLWDTLKESAQSGWTQSWELIIGDFDEAKTLWTSVSDELGGIIGARSEKRNKLLSGALTSKWDQLTQKIGDAGIETEKFESTLKETAKSHGYNIDKLIEEHGSLEAAFRSGEISSKVLRESIKKLEGDLVDLSGIQKDLKKGSKGDDVKKVQQALKDLGYDLGKFGDGSGIDGIIGSVTEGAIKEFQKAQGLKVTGIIDDETVAALEKANGSVDGLYKSVKGLISGVDELGGRELLLKSFANVWKGLKSVLRPIRNAFKVVFPPATSEQLYKLIEGFHSLTEKFHLSGTNAHKVFLTFRGLFSVIKVITNIVGGGFKAAFTLASKLLGAFDLNILDVTSAIGESIYTFGEWLKQNEVVDAAFETLAGWLTTGGTAIRDWVTAFAETHKIGDKVDDITNWFKGLKNLRWEDISSGLISFKDSVVEFFRNFDSSKFVTSIQNSFGNIRNVIGDLLGKVAEKFGVAREKFEEFRNNISDFFTTVKEKIGDHKGSIIAFGSLLTIVFILSKIKKALATLANPFEAFGDIAESFKTFINSFTAKNSAEAFKTRTEAFQNIAKCILILAGSLWIIAKIPKEDMWRAVGVMGIMAGGVLLMALLIKLISKVKTGSETDVLKFGSMVAKLGWALLLMTASVKILGGMDPGELKQGGLAVAGFLGIMVGLMWASKLIKDSDMVKFGKMIRKLSTSLLLLTGVVYILGKMDRATLIQGGLAVTAFLGIMTGVMWMSKFISKDCASFGKMIRNISISLVLLAGAVAIFGNMKTETLIKGGLAVFVFLGLMLSAIELTKLMSDKDVSGFGKMMFRFSAGLILMSVAVKILGEMDTRTLIKGGIAIAAFGGIVVGLMAATKLLGRHSYNAGKVGALLLSFATSILLITASIAALSMIDQDDLHKALGTLAGIGLIFAGLLVVTKFAKNVKTGTIIALSVAVGIMAASIAALAFVPEKDLKNATLALGAIIGMFSLLSVASKFANTKSLLTLSAMALIIGGIGIVCTILVDKVKDGDKALKVAKGMSLLIISLSASCALLAVVSKFGPKSLKGLGVLAGMLAIVGIFAGIAIWQLPNIAKKFSDFMVELQPFIAGAKQIKPSMVQGIKILGEAMLAFTKAGALYAVFDIAGGVTRAFRKFADFIKEIIPVVKDLAVDVSGDELDINTKNLDAVIGAISGLAEASGKVPSSKIALAFGGGKGIFGVLAGISIPMLKDFAAWIKDVIPVVKDLAVEVSSSNIDINGDALASVCSGVLTLAEAANLAPSTNLAFGAGGGNGFGGAFLAISIPELGKFKLWLEGAADIMSEFATDIKTSAITSDDAAALVSICEGVKVLAEAAKEAPGIDAALGLGKFAGGFGLFAGVSIPWLGQFSKWIKEIIPVVADSTIDIKDSKITEADTKALVSICEGVKALGEAAKNSPGTETIVGMAKFKGGFGIAAGWTVPWLTQFTNWIKDIIPVMSDSTIDIKESKITAKDTEALVSICEGVKALGEAAKNSPGLDVGLGFAKFAMGVAGGLYFSVDNVKKFKDWIAEIGPIMSDFTVDVKNASITEDDAATITSICEAVKLLGEAVQVGAKDSEWMLGVAAIGPAVGAFLKVTTTDITAFKDWIAEVGPAISDFATNVTSAELTSDDVTKVTKICEAVKTLAQAADAAPKKEEYSGVFKDWVEAADLDAFTQWIKDVVEALQGLGEKLSASDVEIDTERLIAIAEAAKNLSEAIYYYGMNMSMFNADSYTTIIGEIADGLISFSDKISDIDNEAVSSAAIAARKLSLVMIELAAFDYSTFDSTAFGTKIGEIASAIKTFNSDMDGVDVSGAVAQATALTDVVSNIASKEYDGVGNFAAALKTLSESSIDEFVTAFSDMEELSGVGENMVSGLIGGFDEASHKIPASISNIMSVAFSSLSGISETFFNAGGLWVSHLANGILLGCTPVLTAVTSLTSMAAVGAKSGYTGFYNAGKNVVEGFANGITMNTYLATAKAKAMALKAYEAAKKALDINSPSKIFRSLGTSVPEGFAMGIDKLGSMVKSSAVGMADTAISGTKNAISRIAEAINSDIDAQPTIRPVLDLSDVTAGANSISGMFGMRPSVGVMSNIGAISSSMSNRQNGTNSDVISAIEKLGNKLGNTSGDTYNFDGITYDDGSNISTAVGEIVRAAKLERRR